MIKKKEVFLVSFIPKYLSKWRFSGDLKMLSNDLAVFDTMDNAKRFIGNYCEELGESVINNLVDETEKLKAEHCVPADIFAYAEIDGIKGSLVIKSVPYGWYEHRVVETKETKKIISY